MAGVPGERVNALTSAGAVNVVYGTAAGLSGVGDQIWHQDTAGIEGVAESYDRLASQPLTSLGVYRLPFANGTIVSVTGDHFSHSPDFNEYDMHGEPNGAGQQYTVVATRRSYLMNELQNNYRDLDFGALHTNEDEYARIKSTVAQAKASRKTLKVK